MQPMHRDEGRRKDDAEDKECVVLEDERRVAAGFDEPHETWALVTAEGDDDDEHAHHAVDDGPRLWFELVASKENFTAEEDGRAEAQADEAEDDLHRLGLRFHLFEFACANGLTGHDASGGGKTENADMEELIQGADDGNGRENGLSHAADDGRLAELIDGPCELPRHERRAVFDQIMEDVRIPAFEIRKTHLKIRIKITHEDSDDGQFDEPCDKRGDGGTANFHPWESAVAEYQQIVENDVDEEGHHGVDEADADHFNGSHGAQQRHADAEDEIGDCENAQVFGAATDDLLIIRDETDEPFGEEEGDERHGSRHDECQPQGNGDDILDVIRVALSPILRRQNDECAFDSEENDLQDTLYFRSDVQGGDRHFAQLADHDVVRQRDTEGYDVLENDWNRQDDQVLIE